MQATPDPRRVLVTGAGGRIGRAVCRELSRRRVAVTAVDVRAGEVEGADRVVGLDVTDQAALLDALGDADALVHLAAIPHPSLGTPFDVYRTNAVAAFAALSAAGEAGLSRIVLASSINASGVPFDPERSLPAWYPIDEDLPERIGDAYSLSKRSGELAARMAARLWDLDAVSLRFPLVAPLDDLERVAARDREDPAARVREGWSYLALEDAARAVHAALVAPVTGAVVVGLAAAETTLEQPTEVALGRWAPGVPLRRPLPGRSSAVDAGRARELLGFVPSIALAVPSPGGPPEAAPDVG